MIFISEGRLEMKTIVLLLLIMLSGPGLSYSAEKQPTPKAAGRVKHLKQAVNSFGLHLDYRAPTDKSYYNLTISVQGGWLSDAPNYKQAKITKEQAKKIIDYLGTEGFLDRAVQADHFVRPTKTGYTMNVHIDDAGDYEDLGWGLPMLKRLDGLRKVLDGEAAKKMDVLLERMAGHRIEWEKEEAKPH
jgi:hypothetical protein